MLVALSLLITQASEPRTIEFKVFRCIKASVKDFAPVSTKSTGTMVLDQEDREKLEFVLYQLTRKGKIKLVANPKIRSLDGREFRVSAGGSPDGFEICGLIEVELKYPRIRLGFATLPDGGGARLSSPMTWRRGESPVIWSFKGDKLDYFVCAFDDRPFKH